MTNAKRADEDRNDSLRIGELPELHIVSLDEVVLHEDPDMERVARLVDRFSADRVLKNPPVVGLADGRRRRIVLDGANRVTALRMLDYRHVLAQEIDLADPGLILESWHHAIEHLSPEALLTHARSMTGVSVREGEETTPEAPEALVRFRFADGSSAVLFGGADLMERVAQLHAVTRIYHRFADFDRVSYTNMEHLMRHYRNFTALISFPLFDRQDLLQITANDRRVPSGITRVLLPKRALCFNLQLEILRAGLSLEEKEAWLRQTIREKVADKSIRFYREPTFFFNE